MSALKLRMVDTNRNLTVLALQLVGKLAKAMGRAIDRQGRPVLTPAIKNMSDPKILVSRMGPAAPPLVAHGSCVLERGSARCCCMPPHNAPETRTAAASVGLTRRAITLALDAVEGTFTRTHEQAGCGRLQYQGCFWHDSWVLASPFPAPPFAVVACECVCINVYLPVA
jgi:hypothetical protein